MSYSPTLTLIEQKYRHRERILAVASHIKTAPLFCDVGFNMVTLHSSSDEIRSRIPHECATVSCLGGWTAMIFHKNGSRRHALLPAELLKGLIVREDMLLYVGEVLGIDHDSATELCAPTGEADSAAWVDYPVAAAVWVLLNLERTGFVDWKQALAIHPPDQFTPRDITHMALIAEAVCA